MEDLTGKQLGPYKIVGALGEGGMAAVYKAYHTAMERYVALKILPRHFANQAEFIARFRREAKLLAQLQHPHILPVFDFGESDGYTYLAMPLVKSGTLTDLLKGEPIPLQKTLLIISQVGDALDYAHSRGLVHRDVKPSNVLLDERGNCLLSDFGLARIIEGTTSLTSTGAVMGTPAYMSPEQGSGQEVDRRTDIYSLGVILYETATGRAPFRAETPVAVIFKHMHDPLPPARALNPALPESVDRVILKALAKKPQDRYQTAAEMVTALRNAITNEDVGQGAKGIQSEAPSTSATTLATSSMPTDTKVARRPTIGFGWVWAAAALVVALTLCGAVVTTSVIVSTANRSASETSARIITLFTSTPTAEIAVAAVSTSTASPTSTQPPTWTPTSTATTAVPFTATPTRRPTVTLTLKPTPAILPPCEENLVKLKSWNGAALIAACDYGIRKAGLVSLKLTSNNFAIAEDYSLLIPAQPNQSYTVSYWVRTDLESNGADLYGRVVPAQYKAQAQEGDDVTQNRLDTGFEYGQSVGGKTEWTLMSYTFRTQSNTAFIRLRAIMGGPVGTARGTFWLDEVTLQQS